MRSTSVPAIFVSIFLAGCLQSPLSTTSEPTNQELEMPPLVTPFSFSGSATPIVSERAPNDHRIDVPENALWIQIGFAVKATVAPPFVPAFLDVFEPNGTRIAALQPGDHFLVRLVLQQYALGQYRLRVVSVGSPVTYSVTGAVASGVVPDPIVPVPVLANGIDNDGVVVALIDTGINVYHEAFRTGPPTAIAPVDNVTGNLARGVSLALGEFQEVGLREDDALWRGLERNVLYRFEGTRVLGISLVDQSTAGNYPRNPAYKDPYPILDDKGHGTMSAAAVLSVAPNATIVAVEILAPMAWTGVAKAIDWAASQPWIDVISVSMGNEFGLRQPLTSDMDPQKLIPKATRKAVASGKVYVNSAGNDPTLQFGDNVDGPPWVIAVSGVEPSMKARTALAAYTQDFVSNFTVNAPSATNASKRVWVQGTSFAAPIAAGAFAQAIYELRAATGHRGGITDAGFLDGSGLALRNHDLRNAFNSTAVYWEATEYDPTKWPGGRPPSNPYDASTPVLPTPYVQMGWGYVDQDVTKRTVSFLLDDAAVPAKSIDAAAYMEAQYAARRAFWGG